MKKIALEEHLTAGGPMGGARPQTDAPDAPKPLDHIDNIEERLKVMDDAGIDMQVLSLVFPGNASDASEAISVAQRNNDRLAELIKKYPTRFAGYATVAPQDPAGSANELERAAKNLGLKGTMIFSSAGGDYLDNPKFGVILERAEKLGVPVYLHPSHPSADMIKPYLTYPILSSSMLGFAAEASLHAMRLIISGTFDKYPDLKIILGHLGEAIPFWLWRLDNRWQREKDGMYKNDIAAGKLQKKPSQYFKDNFYVTTSGMFWPPAIQFVCTVLGADRVLFGVDFPQESSKEAVQAMDSVPISDIDREKIYHLNAEKLLSL